MGAQCVETFGYVGMFGTMNFASYICLYLISPFMQHPVLRKDLRMFQTLFTVCQIYCHKMSFVKCPVPHGYHPPRSGVTDSRLGQVKRSWKLVCILYISIRSSI